MTSRPRIWRAPAPAILARGGAARANVFTRIALALFGQLPWRAVPYIPVEIMLLPKWFPFHLDKVSYWSRTVMVPLFVLCTKKPLARNPQGIEIQELFTTPPWQERHYFARGGFTNRFFMALDRMGRAIDPLIPRAMRRPCHAQGARVGAGTPERRGRSGRHFPGDGQCTGSTGADGPAASGSAARHGAARHRQAAGGGADRGLLPTLCFTVWDSALAALAMQEAGDPQAHAAAERALDWLVPEQLLDGPQDWQVRKAGVRGGGWAFQFTNTHYPDLDDTAVVAWSMHQAREPDKYATNISRALDWLVGLQSRNGGFAAFDADNTHTCSTKYPSPITVPCWIRPPVM